MWSEVQEASLCSFDRSVHVAGDTRVHNHSDMIALKVRVSVFRYIACVQLDTVSHKAGLVHLHYRK
jgi:RNA binding exosome subunit